MKTKDILQWAKAHVQEADLSSAVRSKALWELERYFSGSRVCHIDLLLPGTAFQRAVWREVRRVPPGRTIAYGELARRIGHPHAARAVGTALRKNPFPILIPCHRVIPASKGWGEYAGGRLRKAWLLRWERNQA